MKIKLEVKISLLIFVSLFLLLCLPPGTWAAGNNYIRSFATYIGGTEWENIRGVTVDRQGYIYITGGTNSADYPRTFGPAHQSGTRGTCVAVSCSDIFVTKFAADGQSIVWSRLIGTAGHDRAYGIKYHEVGGVGYLLVYGRMGRNYTMTPGVLQTQFKGPDYGSGGYGYQNGFVGKLNPSTGDIIWISYVGTDTLVRNADVDEIGNVYIITGYAPVGSTAEPSPCAPSVSGCLPWYNKFGGSAYPNPMGDRDAVILKVSGDGTSVIWATYYGGTGSEDPAGGISVDRSTKEVIIMMQSNSTGLATSGIFSQGASYHGGITDFLIAKFNSTGKSRLWSGYLGGSAAEPYGCKNIMVEQATGNVIIAAPTRSSNFPTTSGAYQTTPGGGGGNSFVSKISADGKTLIGSTYISGNSTMSNVEGFDLNSRGEVVIGFGLEATSNFPLTADAFQSAFQGTRNGAIAVLSNNLTRLIYSTYYGNGNDEFRALAVDVNDNIIAAGHSTAGSFPTYRAYRSTRNISFTRYWSGGYNVDGTIVKISLSTGVTTPSGATRGLKIK